MSAAITDTLAMIRYVMAGVDNQQISEFFDNAQAIAYRTNDARLKNLIAFARLEQGRAKCHIGS